jgi:rsbT co-antagonist protein RsbR
LAEENRRLCERIAELTERLQRQDLRTELILQSAVEGFHIVGMDGQIHDCNDAFASAVGYTKEELRGMHISALDPNPPEAIAAIIETITKEKSLRFVTTHRHKDGHLIDVEVSVHRVQIGEEQFNSAFSHPLTEQLRREQQLRESEQRFRGIFDRTSMFIGLLSPEGTLLECNRTMLDFIGYGDAPVEGIPLAESAFFGPDEQARRDIAECTRKAASGAEAGCEVQIHGKEGRAAILDLKIKPIANELDKVVFLVAEGYDVTELRRAEAERAALKEQMIHAQEAIIRELSTPLIPLSAGVVIMPLVGRIDQARSQQLLERLLSGVVSHRASTAILDVTGVPGVDAETADALIRAAQAVKLLGAKVILTGVRPEVAQTLVAIGVDLKQIVTLGSLEGGLNYALRQHAR